MKDGPIIVIEDDMDDIEIMMAIFKNLECPNAIIHFKDAETALDFLQTTDTEPFLILSDINMPRISGLDLKMLINANLNIDIKCIPYIFFTTGASRQTVRDAYTLSVQGFFKKPNSYTELEYTIDLVLKYWTNCVSLSEYQ